MLTKGEIQRDEHYVFQKNYLKLKALSYLIHEKKPRCDAIISFIKKYKIDVNSQLPVQNVHGMYYPLIYKCMLSMDYEKVVKFLLYNKAILFQLPNADQDKITELVFVCNRQYLVYLKNKNIKLQLPGNEIIRQVRERIIQGDIKRIYDLQYLNILENNYVIPVITNQELFSNTIACLLNKVAVICNTTNEKSEIDALLLCYTNTIKFLLNNGHNVNDAQMQNIVDMYLISIIRCIKEKFPERNWKNITVHKHKNMNKFKTAYMRQLFNDYNETKLLEMFPNNKIEDSESTDSSDTHSKCSDL
jgi:hypothetical protein|uniref:Uncharacterized protein n=1 Tax=viral metagenome TaxID=1070528 RepID=A0A6C0J504_9ZZZZ